MASTFNESGQFQARHDFHIYYEDTDLSGFVYHANYLKFFERAREHVIGIEFLRDLYQQGLHFVVSKAQLDYKLPARNGDLLTIESMGLYSRSPAIAFQQKALLKNSDGSERLLVQAHITIVILNAQNRPVRMPDNVLEHFHSMSLAEQKDSTILDEESPPW